ncbi:unnamed protein product, partial [Tetraodon nigroviridis]
SSLCHADRHEAGQQESGVPQVPGQAHGPAGVGEWQRGSGLLLSRHHGLCVLEESEGCFPLFFPSCPSRTDLIRLTQTLCVVRAGLTLAHTLFHGGGCLSTGAKLMSFYGVVMMGGGGPLPTPPFYPPPSLPPPTPSPPTFHHN